MKKRVMIRKFVFKVDTFMQWRTWLLYFSSKVILQIFAFISARIVGIGKMLSAFAQCRRGGVITTHENSRALVYFHRLQATMNNCKDNDILLRAKWYSDFSILRKIIICVRLLEDVHRLSWSWFLHAGGNNSCTYHHSMLMKYIFFFIITVFAWETYYANV